MGGLEKNYQSVIDNAPHNDNSTTHWTQIELDLLNCIRDEFPVIYLDIADLTRHQRAAKIRASWKQIGQRFQGLSVAQIKAKWRSILDNYLKVKIFCNVQSECNEDVVKNKYLDGTLKFLEDMELGSYSSPTRNNKNTEAQGSSSYDESAEHETNVSYNIDIRELLHEEINLDDELNDIEIKEEAHEEVFTDNTSPTCVKEIDTLKVNQEPKNKWSEDELMNATRLTKEMIEELILIKTKNYYTSPVTSPNQ